MTGTPGREPRSVAASCCYYLFRPTYVHTGVANYEAPASPLDFQQCISFQFTLE